MVSTSGRALSSSAIPSEKPLLLSAGTLCLVARTPICINCAAIDRDRNRKEGLGGEENVVRWGMKTAWPHFLLGSVYQNNDRKLLAPASDDREGPGEENRISGGGKLTAGRLWPLRPTPTASGKIVLARARGLE